MFVPYERQRARIVEDLDIIKLRIHDLAFYCGVGDDGEWSHTLMNINKAIEFLKTLGTE